MVNEQTFSIQKHETKIEIAAIIYVLKRLKFCFVEYVKFVAPPRLIVRNEQFEGNR